MVIGILFDQFADHCHRRAQWVRLSLPSASIT